MHDIFYFTDVHGMYDLYRAAIDYCLEQDPECSIIYGGDACDRGKDGYKIMKELLDNPRVLYLKGNHEDMFVQAAKFIKKDYKDPIERDKVRNYLYGCAISDFRAVEVQTCVYNGGMDTLTDWIIDGMSDNFVDKINKLPLTFSYENLDFCHAGGDPKIFTKISTNEYNNEIIDKKDQEMVLWDRNWLGFGWIPNRICIFGHTPVTHLPAKYYGQDKSAANAHPCKYIGLIDERLNGYRLDMDTYTIASGRLYVLNCLTMKVQGFEDKDFKDEEIRKHNVEKIEVIQF